VTGKALALLEQPVALGPVPADAGKATSVNAIVDPPLKPSPHNRDDAG
jgi:hypothetical protein